MYVYVYIRMESYTGGGGDKAHYPLTREAKHTQSPERIVDPNAECHRKNVGRSPERISYSTNAVYMCV